jgi:hypothetical protein
VIWDLEKSSFEKAQGRSGKDKTCNSLLVGKLK